MEQYEPVQRFIPAVDVASHGWLIVDRGNDMTVTTPYVVAREMSEAVARRVAELLEADPIA